MDGELTLIEAIELEIALEEKNYKHALERKKPMPELKKLQDKIDYLKQVLLTVENRYFILSGVNE
jgi:hypothetical protein